MIYGIGTDIVAIQRMAENLDQYGERFARRILTDNELAQFHETTKPAHFLAKRFAAKEALVKALGTGFRDGLNLRDISISNDHLGKPILQFSPRAQAWLDTRKITHSHLSLSDEQDFAIAFVTLES